MEHVEMQDSGKALAGILLLAALAVLLWGIYEVAAGPARDVAGRAGVEQVEHSPRGVMAPPRSS